MQAVAAWLYNLPFPGAVRAPAQALLAYAARLHPRAPLVVAFLLALLAAEVVLWLTRQPLYWIWPLFGALSGNSVQVLSVYNWVAHGAAVLVAAKVVLELAGDEVHL